MNFTEKLKELQGQFTKGIISTEEYIVKVADLFTTEHGSNFSLRDFSMIINANI